jgi:hypothetical protein
MAPGGVEQVAQGTALKRCRVCGQEKPRSDFYANPAYPDGYDSRCGDCCRAASRDGWPRRSEQRRQREREWKQVNAEKMLEYKQNSYLKRKRADPEKERAYRQDTYLKRKYGMTRQDYQRRFALQGGLCAICGKPGTRTTGPGPLQVDHDHRTGSVRGLLCHLCNWAIAFLGDTPEGLQRALEYLKGPTGDAP